MTFSFLRILTYVLGLVGTSLLLPLGVALWKEETAVAPAFLVPMLSGWGVAAVFWLLARKRPRVFDVQHAFGTGSTASGDGRHPMSMPKNATRIFPFEAQVFSSYRGKMFSPRVKVVPST